MHNNQTKKDYSEMPLIQWIKDTRATKMGHNKWLEVEWGHFKLQWGNDLNKSSSYVFDEFMVET